MIKPFSYAKQMAIRQLHYSDAVKIFLHCRRRFWEEDDGIFGGTTMTDLPIRGIVYPDHGRETGQGVLLASYAYHEDADRWRSLPAEERIAMAVSYVTKVHPQAREEIIGGVTVAWSEDRYAGGAFAVYAPGQTAQLYQSVFAPEGPIHFAGEHASLKRLWIEGAIESGVRAAQEVHAQSFVAPMRP
jgi:monoamine oxidase